MMLFLFLTTSCGAAVKVEINGYQPPVKQLTWGDPVEKAQKTLGTGTRIDNVSSGTTMLYYDSMDPNEDILGVWRNRCHIGVFVVGWSILVSDMHAYSPRSLIKIFLHGFLITGSYAGRCVILVKSRTHTAYLLVALTNVGKGKNE